MSLSSVLTFLVFSPLLGVLILGFIPKTSGKVIKVVGFLFTLPSLLLAFAIYFHQLAGKSLSVFSVSKHWIQFGGFEKTDPHLFSVYYELGVNGFSLLLVMLTAVVATLAAIAVSLHINKEWKGYFMLFLLLETGMLGVFTAENMILFFIFFEMTLVPTFFLTGKWGYAEKEKAAWSFLIYNGLGSAILLIVIMVLFARTGTTNIDALYHFINDPNVQLIAPLSAGAKFGLFFALLIAFGIKLPIVPLHSWQLRMHAQAPIPVVMIHSGVLLKIGAYGLIRFGLGIFPEQFKSVTALLAILGLINLLYGAFLAFVQNEFKLMLAYSSVSHMGIILLGLAAFNTAGIQGAIFQMVSHGLISSLLFFLVGAIYLRTGTTDITSMGGMAKGIPLIGGFLLATAMGNLGLPGMSGFVSEFQVFVGIFQSMPVIGAIGTLGIIMTACYMLRAVLAMTFGQAHREFAGVVDIKGIEYVPVLVLLLLIVLIGVCPSVLSSPLHATLLGLGG